MTDERKQPLISVLMPVYNADQFLEHCLSCLMAQTLTDFEVIAVDDGSTDNSGRILDEWAAKDERIRVYHQTNSGSASCRNETLRYPEGNYIAWVDADDYVHPHYLAYLYEMILRNNTAIAMCRGEVVEVSEFSLIERDEVEPECVMDFKEYIAALYSPREVEMIVLWNKLYERSLWDNHRFEPGWNIDDAHVVWKLVFDAGKIAVSTKPLYYYRLSEQSVTRGSGSLVRHLDVLACLLERLEFLDRQTGYEYEAYRTHYAYILSILDFIRRFGYSRQERQIKRELRARYNAQVPGFLARKQLTWKTRLKVIAFRFCKALFFLTDRNEQLF